MKTCNAISLPDPWWDPPNRLSPRHQPATRIMSRMEPGAEKSSMAVAATLRHERESSFHRNGFVGKVREESMARPERFELPAF